MFSVCTLLKSPPKIWKKIRRIHVGQLLFEEEAPNIATCAEINVNKLCIDDDCNFPPSLPQPKIVVVGAGIAGLAATTRLFQCGLTDVKLLEAMPQAGGRIKSCKTSLGIYEYGASEIRGACVANSTFRFSAQSGIINGPLKRILPLSHTFICNDGRAIEDDIVQKSISIIRSIDKQAKDAFHNTQSNEVNSLHDFFVARLNKALEDFPEVEKYDASRAMYAELSHVRSKIGANLQTVNQNLYGSVRELPGGNIQIDKGMSSLTNVFLKKIPEGVLQLNKTVECIRWGGATHGSPRAVVRCANNQQYLADFVIVTVSLGVLKNLLNTLFCPELPFIKTTAIKNLGFSKVTKLFLEYEKAFWAGETGNLKLAWCPNDLQEIESWCHGISCINAQPGNILCVEVAGHGADIVDHTPDEVAAEDITEVLKTFTGDRTIPFPRSMARSQWGTSPYFFGATTFMEMRSRMKHIYDVLEPLPSPNSCIPPIILFAGEHTSPEFYGTLHGAQESGVREADRAVQLSKDICVLRHRISAQANN